MSIFEENIENHPCYAVQTQDDVGYLEISCLYPKLQPLYTRWEQYYDPANVFDWFHANSHIPIIACIAYLALIGYGKNVYFSNRPAWNVRTALCGWNLFLSAFSLLGMIRTAPALLHNLTTYSLRDNLCSDPRATYGAGSTGLWIQLFVMSKFPELLDTFFIVVHKKPLIFLHWYHHITVLLYCWHSYATKSPVGIFFVVMNYSVHGIMYGYYFLMAARLRPKWFNPIVITVCQISQMIVGVGVTIAGFYYYKTDPSCKIRPENNIAAFVMYGSYLFLFLQFFIGRYFRKTTKQIPPSRGKKEE